MGILSYFFGTQSVYSSEPKSLPTEQIRRIVSQAKIRTLSSKEEQIIEEAIQDGRNSGRISMKKIDTILQRLVSTNTISIHDKKGVLAQCALFFEKKS